MTTFKNTLLPKTITVIEYNIVWTSLKVYACAICVTKKYKKKK